MKKRKEKKKKRNRVHQVFFDWFLVLGEPVSPTDFKIEIDSAV